MCILATPLTLHCAPLQILLCAGGLLELSEGPLRFLAVAWAAATLGFACHGAISDNYAIGASGVAMALVAANAALFPSVGVRMYGVELSAHHLPLAYLLLDAFSARGQRGEVDLSSHVGGAIAGWVLAQRWKPWYL